MHQPKITQVHVVVTQHVGVSDAAKQIYFEDDIVINVFAKE